MTVRLPARKELGEAFKGSNLAYCSARRSPGVGRNYLVGSERGGESYRQLQKKQQGAEGAQKTGIYNSLSYN